MQVDGPADSDRNALCESTPLAGRLLLFATGGLVAAGAGSVLSWIGVQWISYWGGFGVALALGAALWGAVSVARCENFTTATAVGAACAGLTLISAVLLAAQDIDRSIEEYARVAPVLKGVESGPRGYWQRALGDLEAKGSVTDALVLLAGTGRSVRTHAYYPAGPMIEIERRGGYVWWCWFVQAVFVLVAALSGAFAGVSSAWARRVERFPPRRRSGGRSGVDSGSDAARYVAAIRPLDLAAIIEVLRDHQRVIFALALATAFVGEVISGLIAFGSMPIVLGAWFSILTRALRDDGEEPLFAGRWLSHALLMFALFGLLVAVVLPLTLLAGIFVGAGDVARMLSKLALALAAIFGILRLWPVMVVPFLYRDEPALDAWSDGSDSNWPDTPINILPAIALAWELTATRGAFRYATVPGLLAPLAAIAIATTLIATAADVALLSMLLKGLFYLLLVPLGCSLVTDRAIALREVATHAARISKRFNIDHVIDEAIDREQDRTIDRVIARTANSQEQADDLRTFIDHLPPELVNPLVAAKSHASAMREPGVDAATRVGSRPLTWTDRYRKPPRTLLEAAARTDTDRVRDLIRRRAKIESREHATGRTPLLIACARGYLEVASMLLEAGADVHAVDSKNDTALHLAATERAPTITGMLLERGAELDAGGCQPLHVAARAGSLAVASLLIETGADVNAHDAVGESPLHAAARGGHQFLVELLSKRGATLAATGRSGRQALHWAADGGHLGTVNLLLAQGAAFDAADNEGSTPLCEACDERHHDVVRALLRAGADPDHRVHSGRLSWWCPLAAAIYRDDAGLVRELVSAGADIDTRNDAGRTLLMTAAFGGAVYAIRALLELGCDPHVRVDQFDAIACGHHRERPPYGDQIEAVIKPYLANKNDAASQPEV